jgi:uncharacterized protein YebE (UPF0316 family)
MQQFLEQYPEIIALAIFFARMADVSLGTFRTIMVMRGQKFFAAFVGFFEIMIWLIAAGQVLKNLDQWHLAIAYAGGFAAGNYVGMWLESKFAIGRELVRCLSFKPVRLASKLRALGYNVVSIEGQLDDDKTVEILLIIERRRSIAKLLQTITKLDSNAMYSTTDLRHVYDGPEMSTSSFLNMPFKSKSKRR